MAGVLLYDQPSFELALRGLGASRRLPHPWVRIHNRNERLALDGRGARCEWEFGAELHAASVFPRNAKRLMRRAFADWPIAFRDHPESTAAVPDVSFIIGHRGLERLPQLLLTLRTIAAQDGVSFECIVTEQSRAPEIETALPSWVRYVHTDLPAADFPYCRAWALNVGARQARGRLLILHDNDILAPQRYAFEAMQRFREGSFFLDLKRFIFYLQQPETEHLLAGEALRTDVVSIVNQNEHGGTIAVSREAFFEIGGFDEAFVGWGGEDNDFWDRAKTTGRENDFGYLPFIHLQHPPQPGRTLGNDAPAVKRYHEEIRGIPAQERIARLRSRDFGRPDRPLF